VLERAAGARSKQLPVWVDSMSNKSAEITALANGALNRELERQSSTFFASQHEQVPGSCWT
jgi:hypothetical protein